MSESDYIGLKQFTDFVSRIDLRQDYIFVVLKGSIVSIQLKHSCPENVRKFRAKSADKIDKNGELTEDVLLTSPSAVAAFVGGSSLSGNIMWKTADGRTLKDIESKE